MVKTASSQTLKTGQLAPPFNLKGVDGKTYSLDDFSGANNLLVVFICNHCPYVKARIGDLVGLQSKFPIKDFRIVAINSNDPEYQDEGFDNMTKFAERYSLNFPYLIDDSQQVARNYNAVCTPDPFLFDSNRKLIYHGKINDALEPEADVKENTLENNIRLALEGKKITKDFDPSIGCSIKWKN